MFTGMAVQLLIDETTNHNHHHQLHVFLKQIRCYNTAFMMNL